MKTKNKGKILKFLVIVVIIFVLLASLILFIFFNNKTAKNTKIGNNSTSQEIVDYILNINSYEAKIEVEVQSNKNTNKYIIKQTYKQEEETQEVLEPSNIAGVKLIRTGNTLKLENGMLNLTTVFENYAYLGNNDLDLSSFIKDYQESKNATWEEKNGLIEMKTKNKNNSKMEKILYINKEDGKPHKMELRDNNQKTFVYILYSEVIVNN